MEMMFKKILSAVMVLFMTAGIAACSSDNKNASGRKDAVSYAETEIGSGSGIKSPLGSKVNSKGQLVVLDTGDAAGSRFVIIDADGKPAGKFECSLSGAAINFTLDAQDNIYVLLANYGNGKDKATLRISVISPAGDKLRDIDLSGLLGSGGSEIVQSMYFNDIAVDNAGNIYLDSSLKGIQVLDKGGKPVKAISSEGFQSIDIAPDGGLIAEFLGKGGFIIEKLDASSGKSIWTSVLTMNSTNFSPGSIRVRYSKKDNCIYLMDGQGITRCDMSGKPAGTVLDFRDHSILASGYGISDMCADASGNIYVTAAAAPCSAAQNDTSQAAQAPYKMYRYSAQNDESADKAQKAITVSVPRSDSMLDMAVSKFQNANPGFKVNVETYENQDATGGTMDTYLKNLNTQILSGKGPDIMSVAWLPYKNYASKNVLADLGGMMADDRNFDASNYYSNLFDALKYDGKLYVLPVNFCFNVLMANQAILDKNGIKIDDSKWTWKDFKSILQKIKGGGSGGNLSLLPSLTPNDMLYLFTGGCYNNYIDVENKSASFNSSGFIDLLKMAKDLTSLSDSNVQNDPVSELEAAQRGTQIFLPFTFTDYDMYAFMKNAYSNQLGLYKLPTAGGSDEGAFMLGSLYAINANSKYKPECWELLKTLISDEVQMSVTNGGGSATQRPGRTFLVGGFSISKTAQKNKAQRIIDGAKSGSISMCISGDSGQISFKAALITQNDIGLIDKFIEGLDTYSYYDESIDSIVQDETKAFFSGAKSAEDTAKLIQDRVNTYLGE